MSTITHGHAATVPSVPPSEPVIVLDGVIKHFGANRALGGLPLAGPGGQITVLLGPNGAGKTTAIRMITGAFAPDAGRVRVFGLDPEAQGPQPVRIEVAPGIVAEGLAFTPAMNIDGNLRMPFLKDWIVTLDLAEGRMWVRRNPVPAPAGMSVPPTEKK